MSDEGQEQRLLEASERGDLTAVKTLAKGVSNINCEDSSKWTPLIHAAFGHHLGTVKFLLKKGGDVHHKTIDGMSILHVCAECRDLPAPNAVHEKLGKELTELWELLIKQGSDISTTNDEGETPLHIACLRGNIPAVEVLLTKNVDVNAKNNHGETPLHYASRKGFSNIIELLVSHGADLNAQSEFGTLEQVAMQFSSYLGGAVQSLLRELRGQQEGRVSIFDLPEEVLVGIFSYLQTAEDLCALSSVCKVFHLVASDDILWKPLCCPTWDLSTGQCKMRYIEWLRRASRAYVTMIPLDRGTSLIKVQDRNTMGYDYLIKFLIIGDSGVGKSSFLLRYADDYFTQSYISTIGVDFKIKTININDKLVKLQIWDTAGPERFRTITSSYYRGASGIFVMYDITDAATFQNARKWYEEIDRYANDGCVRSIIGTKKDLENIKRQVMAVEGQALAEELGVSFFETSSKTGENVTEAFYHLAVEAIGVDSFGDGAGAKPRYIPQEKTLSRLGIVKGCRAPPPKSGASSSAKPTPQKDTGRCSVQ